MPHHFVGEIGNQEVSVVHRYTDGTAVVGDTVHYVWMNMEHGVLSCQPHVSFCITTRLHSFGSMCIQRPGIHLAVCGFRDYCESVNVAKQSAECRVNGPEVYSASKAESGDLAWEIV